MKRIFFSLLAFACVTATEAQDSTQVSVTQVTKVTFLDPGVSYERALSPKQTLFLHGFLQTSAYFTYSSALGSDAGVEFFPAINAQYRHYYNGDKRAAAGKRTEMNSMNYLAAMAEINLQRNDRRWNYFSPGEFHQLYTVGALWGLQRNYPKRFSLDISLGLGYYVRSGRSTINERYNSIHKSGLTTLGKLSLGFWLNKRKD